jgi:PAS domain S-box-containing protein
MGPESPSSDVSETLALFDVDGTPLTADEVAERLDVDRSSAIDRLESLTDRGHLAVKSVDPDVRVWWRPAAATDAVGPDERRADRTVETVLERVTDGVYELDDELRFTYLNDRAESLLGVEASSVVGADIRDEVPLTEPFQDALETALREQEPVLLEDYYGPLDAWFENRIYPSETGLSIYFRDVSKRKRLEEELRTEKEQFRVALQNSPVVAFRLDTELRYTWVGNPHQDFDETAVLGKRDDELLPPDAAETVMAPKRRVLETGESVREELTYDLPSGEVTYDLTVEPLRDESGTIVGLTAAALDVTESRRRKQELEERTREFRDQNDRLDRFTAILAHDLRNPLAVARGRTSLLDVPDDQQEHVEAIRRAHDRIESLIDDVLSLAREGRPADDLEPVSLTRVATAAWEQIDADGVALDVDTDQEVAANEGRLQQLFENLFRNSVEHGSTNSRLEADDSVEHGSTGEHQADDGGGPATTVVRVGDLADGSGFFVEDNGPGIPPAERERVFEYGHSTGAEGTGLGLAIVQQIAEAHGWTVAAVESPSGGARFEISTQ